MGTVYLAVNNLTGKCYVGKTIHDISKRRSEHERSAQVNPNTVFLRALNKYGTENFTWKRLFMSEDDSVLCEMERRQIKAHRTKHPYGYNLTGGGDGVVGYQFTEEDLKKLRLGLSKVRRSGTHNRKIGISNLGRRLSKQAKKNISQAKLGEKRGPIPPEQKQAIAEANKRRVWTAESRKKLSDSKRKKSLGVSKVEVKPPATRDEINLKISQAHKGKVVPEEVRLKISQSMLRVKKDQPPSEAVRKAVSRANKNRVFDMRRKYRRGPK